MTDESDWGQLMTMLGGDTLVEEHTIDRTAIISSMTNMLRLHPQSHGDVLLSVLYLWYDKVCNVTSTVSIHFDKPMLQVEDLLLRPREIYKGILKVCDTDAKVLRIHKLITKGPMISKKISGRTIDTLVTRFPRYNDVCYYLDVTSTENTFLLPDQSAESINCDSLDRKIILFDIGSSYRHKMQQYSKTYFDCFGRGEEVLHTLHSGATIRMSLCQFPFFIWADRFKVFDFLEAKYDPVVVIRKQSQKNTYKPKRNPKRKREQAAPIEPIRKPRTRLSPQTTHFCNNRRPVVVMKQDRKAEETIPFKKQYVPSLQYYLPAKRS